MSDKGGEFGSFVAGFLLGGLIGAGAALLLAPQSGEETREQIRQKGVDLQGKAEETMAEARQKVEAVTADVKRRAEDLQQQSRVILEEGQKHLAQVAEEVRKTGAQETSEEPSADAS